jgi:P63C domain-containing protein
MSEKDESKAKGGHARALALTNERKKEIAAKAAAARWLRATHKGNFKDEFGIDVDCYVLDDERKTAVVSQRGMATAIGLSSRGNAFTRFSSSKSMIPYLGAELREKVEKPIRFQWGTGGAQQPPSAINGYDVTLLIDICKAILAADSAGALSGNQDHIAHQARVILNASAKSGITGLVYALAGYDATREEVITAFKLFVRDEAREYAKEFPEQLYEEWYRLYELPKPEKNRPWKFMHLTIDQVYHPLAKSSGKILQLTKDQRSNRNKRHKRLHQFLSEIGVKALRQQLGQLLGIARISKDKNEYESYVDKLFGETEKQPDLFDSST